MRLLNLDNLSGQVLRAGEDQMVIAYRKTLRDLRQEIGTLFEKAGSDGKLSLSDATKFGRLKTLEKNVRKAAVELRSRQNSLTRETITNEFHENFYGVGFNAKEAYQMNLNFGMLDKKAVEAAMFNPLDQIKWTERYSRHAAKLTETIRSTIVQGLIQGHGYQKMMQAVRKDTGLSAGRTMQILRTEAHRAQVEGRLYGINKAESAAERLGLTPQRVWKTNKDDRARQTHRVMDGQIAKLKEGQKEPLFKLPSGADTRGPGLSGIASEDIRCRCSVRFQIKGMEPKEERIKGEGVVDLKTYDEWVKQGGGKPLPKKKKKKVTKKDPVKKVQVPKPEPKKAKAKGFWDGREDLADGTPLEDLESVKNHLEFQVALREHMGMDFKALNTAMKKDAALPEFEEKLKSFFAGRVDRKDVLDGVKLTSQSGYAKNIKRGQKHSKAYYEEVSKYASPKRKAWMKEHRVSVTNQHFDGRANAGDGRFMDLELFKNSKKATYFHEHGHLLEHQGDTHRKSKAWLRWRAEKNGTPKAMKYNLINTYSKDTQFAYKDKFINDYTGKIYRGGHTEVLSMGMQQFTTPKAMITFARKDFDHFSFTLGVLSGAI